MRAGEPDTLPLLARAFHRAPAAEANAAMARVREMEGGDTPATSYEVVLPAERASDYLVTHLLPRLVYFLECRGARLPACAGVFLSIFANEELYFVRASDAIEELSRLSGLSPDQMVQRHGRHGQH